MVKPVATVMRTPFSLHQTPWLSCGWCFSCLLVKTNRSPGSFSTNGTALSRRVPSFFFLPDYEVCTEFTVKCSVCEHAPQLRITSLRITFDEGVGGGQKYNWVGVHVWAWNSYNKKLSRTCCSRHGDQVQQNRKRIIMCLGQVVLGKPCSLLSQLFS